MARTRRGGRRAGRPGANYTNRTDLQQAPRAADTGTYGEAADLVRSQQVVPLPEQPPIAAGDPSLLLSRPTERPDEPVTAGVPLGPGPNSTMLAASHPAVVELRAAYAKYPTPEIAWLLAALDGQV